MVSCERSCGTRSIARYASSCQTIPASPHMLGTTSLLPLRPPALNFKPFFPKVQPFYPTSYCFGSAIVPCYNPRVIIYICYVSSDTVTMVPSFLFLCRTGGWGWTQIIQPFMTGTIKAWIPVFCWFWGIHVSRLNFNVLFIHCISVVTRRQNERWAFRILGLNRKYVYLYWTNSLKTSETVF